MVWCGSDGGNVNSAQIQLGAFGVGEDPSGVQWLIKADDNDRPQAFIAS